MPTDIVEVVSYRVARLSIASDIVVLVMRDHRSDVTVALFFRAPVEMFVENIDRAVAVSFPHIDAEAVNNPTGAIKRELERAVAEPQLPTQGELAVAMNEGEKTSWTIVPRSTGIVLRREVEGGGKTDFHFSPALAYILAYRLSGALGRTTH